MAGDWLKLEKVTIDKPEIFAIADQLGITQGESFMACIRVWCWFDEQTINGHAIGVTKTAVDVTARVTGFGSAMEEVGWLVVESGRISMPHFDRHTSQSAKDRALATKRKKLERSRKSHDGTVTKARPEKSIEKSSNRRRSTTSSRLPKLVAWSREAGWEGISEIDRKGWEQAYPNLSIDVELARMQDWLLSNPDRSKKRNWRRFISNWLSHEPKENSDERWQHETSGQSRSAPRKGSESPQDRRRRQASRELPETGTVRAIRGSELGTSAQGG